MRHSLAPAFVVVASVLIAASPAVAQGPSSDQPVTVSFSDTSRPGLLRVDLIAGSIVVKGTGRSDVRVSTTGSNSSNRGRQRPASPIEPGLRRLNQPSAFTIQEERNVMTISSEISNAPASFEIEVPTRTNLRLTTVNGSQISVEGIEGDIELQNVNGSISVTNVAGSVLATTTNGAVKAQLTRVTAGKPMAFTSLNGSVDVTLPASLKADVKLRSDNGDVLTDFDIQLKTGPVPSVEDTRANRGGRYRVEMNQAIYGTINGGGPEIELRTFNGRVTLRKGS
jgi:hypothetical protein